MVELNKEQVAGMLMRVDKELKKRGIGRKEFYSNSGVTSASYSQWNTGARTPSISSVQRIAAYLGVSLDYLLTGDGEDDAEDIRERLRESPEMRILFNASRDVPPSALLEAAAMLMKYKEDKDDS